MSSKAERLSNIVQELRGSLSQGQFAKHLGISRSAISMWESRQTWPDPENLQKLARMKGWDLEEIQNYLIAGELPSSEDPVEQIVRTVRSLPSHAIAKIAAVAVETLAARSSSTSY